MKKITRSARRSFLTLAGCALVLALASGCATKTFTTRLEPRSPGPHQTYVVTDGGEAGPIAADLVINIRNADSSVSRDGRPVSGCYEVPPATNSPGPHQNPLIVINLIPNPGQATATPPPRKLVVVTRDKAAMEPILLDNETVVLRLPRNMPYGPDPVDARPCGPFMKGMRSPTPMLKSPGPHN